MTKKAKAFVAEEDSDELQALRREVRRLNREASSRRAGEATVLHVVRQLYKDPPDLKIPPKPAASRKKREEIALLHVTDTQIGKVTESYDVATADSRLMLLAEKVRTIVEMRRTAAKVDELVLVFGGDMIEGENIFPGQQFEIQGGVFDQSVKHAPEILTRMTLRLLEFFPKIRIFSVCGNHGRAAPRSQGSHPRTNWDRVCYEVTKLMLMSEAGRPDLRDRVTFDIPESFYAHTNIFDWGLLVVHGDQIRGGFGGFPWYGTGKKAWGWQDSIPEPWDYLYFGHFHQHACAVLNHRTFFATGTPESGNIYAQEQLAAAGFPCQRLQFFDAEHGVIADHQVFLTRPGERIPQRLKRGA